jgi:hypothetical protein
VARRWRYPSLDFTTLVEGHQSASGIIKDPEAARLTAGCAAANMAEREPDFRQARVKPVGPFASAIRAFVFTSKAKNFCSRIKCPCLAIV